MEQFVDSTLRKAAIEQSRRETFDYTNKTDMLASIAAWMAKSDNYSPDKEALRSQMKAYLDKRGLNADLDDLLKEFLNARIFVSKLESGVSFRYRGVLEYFIALRMAGDPDFKEWVLHDDRYLGYANEINYYAGKVRNDASLIDIIADRYAEILAETLSEIGDIDLRDFEDLRLPGDDKEDDIDILSKQIVGPALSREERDAELEIDDEGYSDEAQDIVRANLRDVSDKLAASLFLYSGLIKNMELITDSEKRRHLSVIWRGWATILAISLRFAPRLAKDRRIRISNALYEVQAPQGMSDRVLLRKMLLLLPHIHIRLLTGALGTEKLERQLVEASFEEFDEPKITNFLRAGVISELRLDATPSTIANLATQLSENYYLLWSLVVHIGELRRMDRVKEEHFEKLEKPLAGAIADLRGGTPSARADIKRQQLARLAKDRLMLSYKRKRDKKAGS